MKKAPLFRFDDQNRIYQFGQKLNEGDDEAGKELGKELILFVESLATIIEGREEISQTDL